MRLTLFTDYTLRTLIYLAVRPERLVTIADIANAYGISTNHLMKVVHQLATAGDVTTVRGQHGGLRLARPAKEINIGAVVRRTEADFAIVPCFGTETTCVIQPDCILAGVLDEAVRAFLAVLDGRTLADLVTPRAALREWLRIEAAPA
ncbi:MAG TPA: Rrf2 family transcriptional regulator [Acetobacteraceae bacterium]|jgi:Rrf2 family nitric oxide-sensitive transcriptional repressor